MKKYFKGIWQFFYKLYAVRKNVTLGKNVHLGIGTILWAPNSLKVGNNVYIGKNCTIECDGIIGNDVVIANQVGLVGRWDHDYKVIGKTIRNAPWIGEITYEGEGKKKKIVIEDDVWVGYGAIIFSGVHIKRGAIIGSGALVKDDVDCYSIVVGVPAKEVGKRFSPEEIIKHEIAIYGKNISNVG